MTSGNVDAAIARLDEVLPLRIRQRELPPALRGAHQGLLRCFLETGKPPMAGDCGWAGNVDADTAIKKLLESGLIVVDDRRIAGAYPFTTEAREHIVSTPYGEVRAMCSIDALGVGAMFGLPTTIHSRCRASGEEIHLRQDAAARVVRLSGSAPVFAAMDWNAGSDTASCAATLCLEMMYIASAADCDAWQRVDPVNRQRLTLDEALEFASAIFCPLMD